MKKNIIWVAEMAALIAFTVLALGFDIDGAWNVLNVYVWLLLVMLTVLVIGKGELERDGKLQKNSVRAGIESLILVWIALWLIYAGNIATGIACIFVAGEVYHLNK